MNKIFIFEEASRFVCVSSNVKDRPGDVSLLNVVSFDALEVAFSKSTTYHTDHTQRIRVALSSSGQVFVVVDGETWLESVSG